MASAPAQYPTDEAAKLEMLLAAVESIADVLVATRDETEESRTLAPVAAEALRDAGLNRLKAPLEVGGAEADPVTQMRVIEAVTMLDPAAAWSMFITSAVTGNALSRVPDHVVDEMLDGGFPFMVGSLKPGGTARRIDGGYRLSGRWAWGSGIHHADYVSVPVLAEDGDGGVHAIVPAERVTVHDNWFTLGMRGTGSCDYSLDDVFVADDWVTELGKPNPQRGGALYRMGMPGFVINEHGCFAWALARLALATFTEGAIERRRGYVGSTSVADREVVQRTIGEATMRLNATELLMVEVLERLFAAAEATDDPLGVSPQLQAEARAAAVWCTDEALDVATSLLRYAGGRAVMAGDLIGRCVRDLLTIQSHLVVSDVAYEAYGQLLLGLTDTASLG